MNAALARLRALGPNARGCLWALLATLCFGTMDAGVKFMGAELHALQVAFFRCFFALMATLPWLLLRAGPAGLRPRKLGGHVLRALFGYAAMASGFVALANMNFADAVALGYVRPLFLVPLAVLLLGERANLGRWIAISVGFAGVVVMLRPGAGIVDPYAGLALLSGFFVACVSITMKRLAETERPEAILFWFSIFASTLAIGPAIWVWRWPEAWMWPPLIGLGILGTLGQYLIVRAYRIADATAVDPVDYTKLVFAAALGVFAFGEALTPSTLAGTALIVLSTLYLARGPVTSKPR